VIRRRALVSSATLVVALLIGSCTGNPAGPTAPHAPITSSTGATSTSGGSPPSNALVTRVVDGDTVEVDFRGRTLTVRLIGIDTPESVAPGEPVRCFAIAASSYTTERLEGERVRLQFDVERIDPYGRTLAYVWLGGELYNETLVRAGYAFVTTYPPNVRHVDRFRAAQREARSADRGVWDRCVHEGACDPAYPDRCLPPPPPDLDCSDIDQRRFTVLPPDPHNFDGDRNGLGCESS
jgi:endonuclease YncB( thermonuclease family)